MNTFVCAECGAGAATDAEGWRMCRADDELEDEEPELVAFCPECAAREFD
jgi:ribosomal protein L40E